MMPSSSFQQTPKPVDLDDPRFEQYDCLPCRLVGAGAFTGLGIYAYSQSRIPLNTPNYKLKRFGILGMAYGFILTGVYRLFQ
ncbi:mitochondrial DUF4536, human DMAC1 ortholog, possibly has a general role in mitochondrial complex assembly [Schizosaccharomyces pombe]|uniref:Mitochondrial protein-disulfide reductase dmo2 n=2 Tax=Schizosaccharomyces pombe TaxID=4896 RepID=DMO2_SCHPO|nr:protein tam6 [Schizosaccharomyces pombe]G2TRJ5.1 RecName: Full=Uncharacterized protein tam6, mitochondrial; AltName: Full=Transcripts altered in meiosis protein 6 [Schizosaccharomyces pombe 972h-]BAN67200.1 mitochondrial conserved protein [Schizosaccharomyces pombe]CCD31338.1 mitochondrial conserved protein [Schizosaccharomyces pombe]|eukprot:NP_001343128.1 protein tam6 [Schizosaccharomyces pombe]